MTIYTKNYRSLRRKNISLQLLLLLLLLWLLLPLLTMLFLTDLAGTKSLHTIIKDEMKRRHDIYCNATQHSNEQNMTYSIKTVFLFCVLYTKC
jgi:hypothetical protein